MLKIDFDLNTPEHRVWMEQLKPADARLVEIAIIDMLKESEDEHTIAELISELEDK